MIQMFASMFLSLTLHSFRQHSNGEKSLLVYAGDTCRQWHRDIEEGNSAANLATIVPERLENISNELHDKSKVLPMKVGLFFILKFSLCWLDIASPLSIFHLDHDWVFLLIWLHYVWLGCSMHNFGCTMHDPIVLCTIWCLLFHSTSLILWVLAIAIPMVVAWMSNPTQDPCLPVDTMMIIDWTTILNTIIVAIMTDLVMRLATETEFLNPWHPQATINPSLIHTLALLALISLLFEVVHHHWMPLCVPSVSASTQISNSAAPQPCGMEEQPDVFVLPMVQWSTRPENQSASIGTDLLVASVPIPAIINAQAVEAPPMEPSTVLMCRRNNAVTPLCHDAWLAHLSAANLIHQYPTSITDSPLA